MITISRSTIRRVRVVLSRGLGLSRQSAAPPVVFQPHQGGLSIRMRERDAALAYQHPESAGATAGRLAVPFDLFKRCESKQNEPVTFTPDGEEVVAQWADAGIPQTARALMPELAAADEFPPMPAALQPNNGPELFQAFRDAVATTDSEATRYALNCIELRGGTVGRIAATDSHQLLVQNVGSFPWNGNRLVPASRIFECADFNKMGELEVGCSDDWVTLRSGPWTVHLRIEKESRFPAIEHHIPQAHSAKSTLHLSDADAEFLGKAVSRLPASTEFNAPITVDLNGAVSIRAKAPDDAKPTELVLSGSRRGGAAIRFDTNRDFLARAVRLGFRDVYVFGEEAPACCQDQHRHYIWMLLGKGGSIAASTGAVRIESSAEPSSPPNSNLNRSTTTTTMANSKQPNSKQHGQNGQNGHSKQHASPQPTQTARRNPEPTTAEQNGHGDSVSIIGQAEALRDTLAQALTQTRALVSALKRRKKQSRLVQSTLASLRELEAVAD